MSLQFINDNKGNTTGVFIPIEDWQALKSKYTELMKEEAANLTELSTWQKKIIDQRLNDYYSNKSSLDNFDTTLNEIEKGL
ncbi:MAG: hypothetical protein POELPBGB_00586 [Bacteroidia bacterium]|nr:hypothetical protein [Bacteroidia bacterium]